MLKLLVLLLTIACNANISTDRNTEEVQPNTKAGGNDNEDNRDEQDNDGNDNNLSCSFEKQNSDEYYNLNFIKPQSDEHTQLFLEYFKYFNAEIKKQHRRFHPQCSPLDDVLAFADDTSDACKSKEERDSSPNCPLYSTINIIEITDAPDDEGFKIGGYAERTTYRIPLNDGTIVTRHWIQIFLGESFLVNHRLHKSMAMVTFLHEIGHGFGLEHHSDEMDIMHYRTTSTSKHDYNAYFERVYQIITSVNFLEQST